MNRAVRILILEDRASDADLIEFGLEEAGIAFTSHRVAKERDFVRALQEFSPDLILSDYDLPQYSEIIAQGARGCVLKNHLDQLAPAVLKVLTANDGNGNAAGRRES
jgi:CheY-like chemotaxis protein